MATLYKGAALQNQQPTTRPLGVFDDDLPELPKQTGRKCDYCALPEWEDQRLNERGMCSGCVSDKYVHDEYDYGDDGEAA